MKNSEFNLNLAVVIGINDYQNGISPLGTARQDAEAVAHLLETEYHFQVHLITDKTEIQATSQNLKTWLETKLPAAMKAATPSRLLFYFAGHGIALDGDEGPQGYLIPQDAKLGDVSTYLPMQQVEAALAKLPCRHCLVILDCCFAGAFRWSSTRHLAPINRIIHKERFDRFIQDPAWQVITSAASDQYALDMDINGDRGIAKNNTQHSPFAAALIEALSGSADVYPPESNGKPAGDGIITATELYIYLRDSVEIPSDANDRRQTPQIWCLKKHDKGEFIFLPPGHVLNLPTAPKLDELEDNNPYRGLESYEKKHSALFFGRTALIEKLCDAICDRSFTVVLGASGSGKSSLVKAGSIAHLERSAQTDQTQNKRLKPQKHPHQCKYTAWKILSPIRPGESPLNSLKSALKELGGVETDRIDSQILIETIAVWSQEHPGTKLLLVIDQFEELITLCQKDVERQQFLDILAELVKAHLDVLRLVLTLRSDFEPQFRSTPLEHLWQAARFPVSAMKREELREVIEEPASAKVVYFESSDRGNLVEQLIDEVADMPGALPLLSFALSELYRKLAHRYLEADNVERAITWVDYDALGGVAKSLTQRADEVYGDLVKVDPAYEKTIRNVMLRMVATGSELARRQVHEKELNYPQPENTRVKEVLSHFSSARLLVSGTDADDKVYIEPAHDVLVRSWSRLIIWLQEKQENKESVKQFHPLSVINYLLQSKINQFHQKKSEAPLKVNLPLQRELTIASNNWWAEKKQVGFLWNADPRLPQLEQIICSEDDWLNVRELEFIKFSREQRQKNTRNKWLAIGGIITTSIGAAFFFNYQRETAELNRDIATSEVLLKTEPTQGLVTAIRSAYKSSSLLFDNSLSNSESVLFKALNSSKELNILQGKAPITSVAIDINKNSIASIERNGTIRLWSVKNLPNYQILPLPPAAYNSISFNNNGQILAIGGGNGEIILWDIAKKNFLSLPKTKEAVSKVIFSPINKDILVSGYNDGKLRLWNLKQGNSPQDIVQASSNSIEALAFSPDGTIIASGGWERGQPIKLWTLEANTDKFKASPLKLIASERERGDASSIWEAEINSIVFSPDSNKQNSTMIVGSSTLNVFRPKRTIWHWKLSEKTTKYEPPILIEAHNIHSYSVDFISGAEEGSAIVSAGDTPNIQISELSENGLIEYLIGHKKEVKSIAVSHDRQLIISGGDDGKVRIWIPKNLIEIYLSKIREYDLSAVKCRNYLESLNSSKGTQNTNTSCFKSGKTIASFNENRVELKDSKGQLLNNFQQEDRIYAVAISLDGKRIATASSTSNEHGYGDSSVRLFNDQGYLITQFEWKGANFKNDCDGVGDCSFLSFSESGNSLVGFSHKQGNKIWPANWKVLVMTGCDRLRNHPVITNPQTRQQKDVQAICLNFPLSK